MPRRLKVAAAVLFLAGGALAISLPKPPVEAAPTPAKTKQENYTETIKPKEADDEPAKFDMVAIPGGTFDMGSSDAEKGHNSDESPVHAVTIRPFWMGKCEVTWDEWDLYKKEAGVENKEAGNPDPGENEKRLKADPDAITGPTPHIE